MSSHPIDDAAVEIVTDHAAAIAAYQAEVGATLVEVLGPEARPLWDFLAPTTGSLVSDAIADGLPASMFAALLTIAVMDRGRGRAA